MAFGGILVPATKCFTAQVSRLVALSESHGMHLALDYNTELYPLTVGSRFTFALASSLSSSVDPDESEARNVWRPDNKGRAGIEKDYDYVMYGKV
jgi:DNA-directed RNA polymerase I, II, and III subunit RPABC3